MKSLAIAPDYPNGPIYVRHYGRRLSLTEWRRLVDADQRRGCRQSARVFSGFLAGLPDRPHALRRHQWGRRVALRARRRWHHEHANRHANAYAFTDRDADDGAHSDAHGNPDQHGHEYTPQAATSTPTVAPAYQNHLPLILRAY